MTTQPSRRKVLIVDDEETVRAALAAALEMIGDFAVTSAPDGASGLALIEKTRPDIVLLDLVLPDIDGLQFIKRMRGTTGGFRPGVVVLMTAYPDPFPREHLPDIGADALLEKPFQLRQLSSVLGNRQRASR